MSARRHPTRYVLVPAAAIAGAAAAWLHLQSGWQLLWAWLVPLNLVVLPVWAWDKWQAKRDWFRVPEAALHLLALAGAVPGSLAAMALLRHKTRKRAFRWPYTVLGMAQALAVALWLRPDWRPW